MIVDEKSRNELYAGLQEVLGPERAAILMAYLSPLPWSDLATKPDLLALRGDFDREFAGIRGEFTGLRGEFTGLRGEFDGLRGEFGRLRADFDAHRTATKEDFAALRGDFEAHREATKADIQEKLDLQTQLLRSDIRDQGVSFTLAMADQRDVLRKEMIQQTWVIVFALVATMASLAGVFMAAG